MIDVVRAWKDEEYYLSLTEEQRRALPAHPAALIELSDEDLRLTSAGSEPSIENCTIPRGACTKSLCP